MELTSYEWNCNGYIKKRWKNKECKKDRYKRKIGSTGGNGRKSIEIKQKFNRINNVSKRKLKIHLNIGESEKSRGKFMSKSGKDIEFHK